MEPFPRQDGRLAVQTCYRSSEIKPVLHWHVELGNRKKTCKPGLGCQEVVTAGIQMTAAQIEPDSETDGPPDHTKTRNSCRRRSRLPSGNLDKICLQGLLRFQPVPDRDFQCLQPWPIQGCLLVPGAELRQSSPDNCFDCPEWERSGEGIRADQRSDFPALQAKSSSISTRAGTCRSPAHRPEDGVRNVPARRGDRSAPAMRRISRFQRRTNGLLELRPEVIAELIEDGLPLLRRIRGIG